MCILSTSMFTFYSMAEIDINSDVNTKSVINESKEIDVISENNHEVVPMVGGSDSPSGIFQVKKRYVTSFKNKKEIEAAYNYTKALYNKSKREMDLVDFFNLLAANSGNNPISLSVWFLTSAISFLDNNNFTIQSKIRNSYSVISSAKKRFYNNGGANVKTVLYERPLNGSKIIIYE